LFFPPLDDDGLLVFPAVSPLRRSVRFLRGGVPVVAGIGVSPLGPLVNRGGLQGILGTSLHLRPVSRIHRSADFPADQPARDRADSDADEATGTMAELPADQRPGTRTYDLAAGFLRPSSAAPKGQTKNQWYNQDSLHPFSPFTGFFIPLKAGFKEPFPFGNTPRPAPLFAAG
jgi:hypothetical protein